MEKIRNLIENYQDDADFQRGLSEIITKEMQGLKSGGFDVTIRELQRANVDGNYRIFSRIVSDLKSLL